MRGWFTLFALSWQLQSFGGFDVRKPSASLTHCNRFRDEQSCSGRSWHVWVRVDKVCLSCSAC